MQVRLLVYQPVDEACDNAVVCLGCTRCGGRNGSFVCIQCGFLLTCRKGGQRRTRVQQLQGVATVRWAEVSPERLLRQGTSHLAGIARQGNGEGVLALSQTQRSALLAPALEIAAKRAVESRRIETRHPRHQAGPRQCPQAGQLDPPEMLGPALSRVIQGAEIFAPIHSLSDYPGSHSRQPATAPESGRDGKSARLPCEGDHPPKASCGL
jgi:hypothetical protein